MGMGPEVAGVIALSVWNMGTGPKVAGVVALSMEYGNGT